MSAKTSTARKLQVALSVAAVAGSLGTAGKALAGPTLSSLINLSNSAQMTVNNSIGQSFSANGTINANITPFAAGVVPTLVNTAIATLSAASLGLNPLLGGTAGTFNATNANVSVTDAMSGVIQLASLTGLVLAAASGVTTVGASITNSVFGVSNVQMSSSFTNQTTTSLTAF